MSAGPRLCIECQYHDETANSFNDQTMHKCWRTVDLVTGKTKPAPCAVVRDNAKLCGPMGKWFKKREDALEAAE